LALASIVGVSLLQAETLEARTKRGAGQGDGSVYIATLKAGAMFTHIYLGRGHCSRLIM
jgi:hypothetical protein